VLDELTYPLLYGWIEVARVVEAIKSRPITCTSSSLDRRCPAELIEIADTVTEMTMIKHAFKAAFLLSTALSIEMLVAPVAVESAGAIVVAFLVDHFLGEPPARFHPVVWIGKGLSSTAAPWVQETRAVGFLRGTSVWLLGQRCRLESPGSPQWPFGVCLEAHPRR